MKKIIFVLAVTVLSGCAQIKMMLVKHDTSLASAFVQTKINLEAAKCDVRDTLKPAYASANFMSKYAEFRDDPQKESAAAVFTNVQKAVNATTDGTCQRWLNLANQRMSILNKAWSDR